MLAASLERWLEEAGGTGPLPWHGALLQTVRVDPLVSGCCSSGRMLP